jgi:hypothetical protein
MKGSYRYFKIHKERAKCQRSWKQSLSVSLMDIVLYYLKETYKLSVKTLGM